MYWVLSRFYLFIIKDRGKRVLCFYGSKKAHCRQLMMVVQVTHARVASFPGRGTENHRNARIPDKDAVSPSCACEDWNSRNKHQRAHPVTKSLSSYQRRIIFDANSRQRYKICIFIEPTATWTMFPRAPKQWNNSLCFFQQKLLLLPAPHLI